MDLTDEQKRRIAEEEQQRLAEEQYRQQVRRELESQMAVQAPLMTGNHPLLRKAIVLTAVALIVLSIVTVYAVRSKQSKNQNAAATIQSGAPADGKQVPAKLTTAQIAEKATPSVVLIDNLNQDGEKMGQGSGYSAGNGVIITNYHVIRGAGSLNVRVPNQEPYRVDSILGYDPQTDVAALELTDVTIPELQVAVDDDVKVGDRVVAIGSPLGLESTVSEGIVSAVRDAGVLHLIQTTTSISPGSSGGPLLNEYGRVIGLTTAQVRDGQNLNFVIAARHITNLLNRKHPITLSEMLVETQVTDELPSNTLSVPARSQARLTFNVLGQQGAVLEGTYTVAGGMGNDIDVILATSDNRVVVNSGRVKAEGQIKQRLPPGSYAFIFSNTFSTFTSKSISPDLKLVHYR